MYLLCVRQCYVPIYTKLAGTVCSLFRVTQSQFKILCVSEIQVVSILGSSKPQVIMSGPCGWMELLSLIISFLFYPVRICHH